MIKSSFRRTATLLSASALALGVASTGLVISSAGASPATPGVSAKAITIGATVPISGVASSYASVSASANAVFKYINAHGGINGRKIKFIRLDDCYGLAGVDPTCTAGSNATTQNQTKVLVAQDHVFATVGSLGTAAQDSVRTYLKQNHVPQLFVNSGSSDWNKPTVFPNLFGFQTSYQAEGKIFAQYIKRHYKGKSVGFIGQGDDFGANGYAGLVNGGLTVNPAFKLSYSPADALTGSGADLQTDVGTLAAGHVKVVVLDSTPAFTQGILKTAAAFHYSPKWIISSVGSDPTSVNNVGEAGAVTLDYFPATNNNKDPWVVWLRKVLKADHADWPGFGAKTVMTANALYGAGYAVAFAETLKAEGKNVTRAGFVKTLKSISLATPAITPLRYSASNHQGMLGGVIATIARNGTQAPNYAVLSGKTLFTTLNGSGSPIHKTSRYVVTTIPKWLK